MQAVVEDLDGLAHWLIEQQKARAVDRWNRPRRRIGTKLRTEFFRRLETGAWLEPEEGRLPGWTWDPAAVAQHGDEQYGGPFVEYAKAYCGILARYIEAMRSDIPALIGLADALRSIESSGVHVRDGIKKSGFRLVALRLAREFKLGDDQKAVLDALRPHPDGDGGCKNVSEIAHKLFMPEDKVLAILENLVELELVVSSDQPQ